LPESLMNGVDLPAGHGAPVRVACALATRA
jgi:DMSO/TMAO reductase YedYZ molybdopterin-dependent catalytic subunit